MIKKGIVVAIDGNIATVEEIKDAYCLDCINRGVRNKCVDCKNRLQNSADRHISTNNIEAQTGDIVEYKKDSTANVIFSLIVFVLPVLLAVVAYILCNLISSDDPLSSRVALAVLSFSMIGAGVYSYKISKRRCDYKIISKI